jgi:CshA-type fibril repeat protein
MYNSLFPISSLKMRIDILTKLSLVLSLFLFLDKTGFAQAPSGCSEPATYDFVSINNGSWTSGSTWQGGVAPSTTLTNRKVLITHDVNYASAELLFKSGSVVTVKNGGGLTAKQIQMEDANTKLLIDHASLTVAAGNLQVKGSNNFLCAQYACINVGENLQIDNSSASAYFLSSGVRVGYNTSGNFQSIGTITGNDLRVWLPNGNLERNGGTFSWATISHFRVSGNETGLSGTKPAEETTNAAIQAVITPCNTITVSGRVWNDVDASLTQNGSEAGTNAGSSSLRVNLVNASNTIVATAIVAADGTYTLSNVPPSTTGLRLVLTTTAAATSPGPLPTGWINTGENVGAGNTATQNATTGQIELTTGSTDIANQNFGIQQPPTAVNDVSNNNNYGTPVTVSVLTNDSDPTPGNLNATTVSMVTPGGATSIQTDANGDVIGMTIPNQGRWTVNPTTGAITFTPQAGFTGNPTPIQYTVDDNGGAVSNPATVTITYLGPVLVSGAVYWDINGVSNIDGNLTNGQGLYVNVLNGSNQVVYVATVGQNCSGQVSAGQFCVPAGTLVSGNYTLQLSKNQGVIGQPQPVKALNTKWFTVGESLGSTGNDGSADGLLAITLGASNVTGLRFGIVPANDAILPVKWVYFKAISERNSVLLEWATAAEQQNKGFSIERSNNGVTWNNIGSVNTQAANGNSSAQLTYSFTDQQPLTGKSFYRLIQTDLDEKQQYSEIRTVNSENLTTIHLSPNPAATWVKISGLRGTGNIYLTNLAGQRLQTVNITGYTHTLDIKQLPVGLYFITVTEASGIKQMVQKLVKN